jgi:myosin regulatory light chain 12
MGKGDGKGAEVKHFDEATLETYKECFKLMDIDKDGVINKTDLRAAFDNVGRLVMDDELNSMLQEVGGACNYDNMIAMFEAKMAGGVNDPDDLVVNAFKAFDEEVEEKVKGVMVTRHIIDRENFTHILMSFGDKMNQDEIDDIYGEFEFDDNKDIFTKTVVDLFVAGAMDEKKEEEEEAAGDDAADAAPAGDEGVKKKKKKKKAAK